MNKAQQDHQSLHVCQKSSRVKKSSWITKFDAAPGVLCAKTSWRFFGHAQDSNIRCRPVAKIAFPSSAEETPFLNHHHHCALTTYPVPITEKLWTIVHKNSPGAVSQQLLSFLPWRFHGIDPGWDPVSISSGTGPRKSIEICGPPGFGKMLRGSRKRSAAEVSQFAP